MHCQNRRYLQFSMYTYLDRLSEWIVIQKRTMQKSWRKPEEPRLGPDSRGLECLPTQETFYAYATKQRSAQISIQHFWYGFCYLDNSCKKAIWTCSENKGSLLTWRRKLQYAWRHLHKRRRPTSIRSSQSSWPAPRKLNTAST